MEFTLHYLLAFAAAYRGWNVWPFALVVLPFVPLLAHASSGGDVLSYGVAGSALSALSLAGLLLMVLVGRKS